MQRWVLGVMVGSTFGHVALAADPRPPPATPGPTPGPTSPPAGPGTPAPDDVPAGIAERITQAESAFRIQNYQRVIQLLDRLVGHPKLEGRPEHTKILEWLGASHWFVGAHDASRLVFGELLRESPFFKLDEFYYPAELIAFYEERRKELVQANIIPERPGTPEPPKGPRQVLVRDVTKNATPLVAYFAPFGIGQFANDQDTKGTVLAILQGLGAGTMVGTWVGIETLKPSGSNVIRASDGGTARLLDGLWYGGMALFVASWAYSIVDGIANRDTGPKVEQHFELLDPEALKPPQLTIVPGPGEIGLGLGVTW